MLEVDERAKTATVQRVNGSQIFSRHPDDLKLYHGSIDRSEVVSPSVPVTEDMVQKSVDQDESEEGDKIEFGKSDEVLEPQPLRRSARARVANSRFIGDDFVNL